MSVRENKSRSERAIAASIWTIGGKLIAKGIDFVTIVILGRLLSPADFGLVAIAMTAVVLVESVMDLPVAQVLVRTRDPTRSMFDTAFTMSILRGIAAAALLALSSWPVSVVYGDPRLMALICGLSLAPALRGAQSPLLVGYVKRMDFRPDFYLTFSGKLIALILAASIAFKTRSYWALAVGTIATALTMNIMSYAFAPYRPRWTLSAWKAFANTISWNSLSQLIMTLNWNVDRILLGRYISQSMFGRFVFASDVASLPTQAIVSPIVGPMLAAFSPLVGSANLASAYLRSSNAILALAAPAYLVMGILAEPLIRILMGEAWIEAAPILKWLALFAILALPGAPMGTLALVLDRVQGVTARMTIELIVKIPLTLCAILLLGLTGAIMARVFSAIVMFVVTMFIVKRLIGLPIMVQLRAVARTAISLSAMGLVLGLSQILVPAGAGRVELAAWLSAITCISLFSYVATLLLLWKLDGSPPGVEQIGVQRVASLRKA